MSFLLDLSEEHRLILETLRRAGLEANEFGSRRKRLRAEIPERTALWQQIANLGALGACFTEAQGGIGGTPRMMAILTAAFAPVLPVEPVIASGITAARLLGAAGANEQIEALISGASIPVPALFETADPFAAPAVEARQDQDNWRISGKKPAVRHGDVATHFLVSARVPDGDKLLLLCDRAEPNLSCRPYRLIDAAGAADLAFGDAPATLLLKGAVADHAISDAIDWTLTALVVETASLCETVNVNTFAYMKERQQFGTQLAKLQALRFKAADMHMAATETAAAADAALLALEEDASTERTRRILSSSLAADRAGRDCAHYAVQMHGGMGVSDELVISHYARRLAAIRSQIGTMAARAAKMETMGEDLQRD